MATHSLIKQMRPHIVSQKTMLFQFRHYYYWILNNTQLIVYDMEKLKYV